MRILFVGSGSSATVYALAPLATAARNSGHEVFMAAHAQAMPAVVGVGLPAVPLTERPLWEFIGKDRSGRELTLPTDPAEGGPFAGRAFARMAAANFGPLIDLAHDWRPDLVVGGTMSYAAGLLGARLGIPVVRQAWDISDADTIHPGADEELRPELREMGLDRLPEPDLLIDICPPALRPPGAPPAQLMRWRPGNQQQILEPWMYARGDRPRVCLTSGSRASLRGHDNSFTFLRDMAKTIGALDVELVVAAPEDIAAELRAESPAIRSGWFPLDVVAPTTDLMIHHGGGVTMMTAMNAGVPQLVLPNGPLAIPTSRRLSAQGSALTLVPGQDSPRDTAAAAERILGDASFRRSARVLAREIAGLPLPSDVVRELERL
ncbi:glycosyltransferase [Streptomyces sp. NPDC050439]|uniref:glycosyltransferase n=1 Tax=unclassified Streptomyces TaxID=2593676 RepID=UPI003436C344